MVELTLLIALLHVAIKRGLRIATVAAFALPCAVGVTDVFVAFAFVAAIGNAPEERVVVVGSLNVVGQDSVIIQTSHTMRCVVVNPL